VRFDDRVTSDHHMSNIVADTAVTMPRLDDRFAPVE
jgi:hypothetical protein